MKKATFSRENKKSSDGDGKKEPLLSAGDLDVEHAEGAVIRSLEERQEEHKKAEGGSSVFLSAAATTGHRSTRPSLMEAQRAQRMQHLQHLVSDHHHKSKQQNKADVHNLLSVIQETQKEELDGLKREDHYTASAFDNRLMRTSLDSKDDDEHIHTHGDSKQHTLPTHQSIDLKSNSFSKPTSPRTHNPSCWKRFSRRFCSCCHPLELLQRLKYCLATSLFLWVGIPLFSASEILYRFAENPRFEFMPGTATVAWWLLLLAMHTFTYELARFTVWLVIDVIILGTKVAHVVISPFIRLAAATGRGWPFLLAFWGAWDFLLLEGKGDKTYQLFSDSWFIFANINSGNYILDSHSYRRFLLSMIFAGCAVVVKRTLLALRFGRRQFAEFKPRLEKILADVVILNEVALLAEQADRMEDDEASEYLNSTRSANLVDVSWFHAALGGGNSTEEDEGSPIASSTHTGPSKPQFTKSESSSLLIKDKLDRWQEPVNKLDKVDEVTIEDILKFRRALTQMDETHTFGEAFGPSTNRDECIVSSHAIYYKLMKLAPDAKALPFDVLALLAVDENGKEDLAKKTVIRKIFTPDLAGTLPLLAFVQSCDGIYKRFRFFRASVGNASVIDKVLENIANVFFFFMLILMLLSLLEFNPWTFLVPITSLLVSFSFALGSSISRYVEGVMLIAVRRPFDLGDRIFMSGAESINPTPNVTENSWFVEDISLATTTLRYCQTNEVSTVNNWAISSSRIVNCARSLNAIVHFELKTHMSVLEDDKMQQLTQEIRRYVEENPRIWESVVYIRHDVFDPDTELVEFKFSLRHRSSWQDSARIKMNRAEVFRFIYETAKKLSIQYESPPPQLVLYHGGVLKEGERDGSFKRDLLQESNVQPYSDFPKCKERNQSPSFDPALHTRLGQIPSASGD